MQNLRFFKRDRLVFLGWLLLCIPASISLSLKSDAQPTPASSQLRPVPDQPSPLTDRPRHSPSRALDPRKTHPMKHVLITGFYDWKELGTPPQLDRCRDNPSCRVLTGSGIGSRDLSGPLATQLKAWASARPSLQLHFALLPVTWASHADLELEKFDQVIHLGLGVYDSNHRILIEEGAYNRHRGQDAAGVSRDQRIEEEADSVLIAPPQVQEGLKRALSVSLPAPFTLSSIPAREENSYLCNAVHFRALQHIHSKPEGQLQQAYFVHIPHAENQDDRPLAAALFKLLIALLGS